MKFMAGIFYLTAYLALSSAFSPLGANETVLGREARAARVSYGNLAAKAQFPWVVSLNSYNSNLKNPYVYECVGTLIHRNWVLTAAHCTDKWSSTAKYFVRLGSLQPTTGGLVVSFGLASVTKNPGYIAAPRIHDLALIKIDYKEDSDLYWPVPKIFTREECCENWNEKELFLVKGWGHTQTTAALSNDLLFTTVYQIPNLSCLQPYYTMAQMNPGAICSVKGAPCLLDDGGPMDHHKSPDDSKSARLYGVVSNPQPAKQCGAEWPARYMKVCMYHDWLTFVTSIDFSV